MKSIQRRKVSVPLCLLFLFSLLASAQERGGITGTVTDPSGASLAHADVKVTNVARGETITLQRPHGFREQYTAVNLIPGIYSVRVESAGFRPSVHTGIEVKVADVSRVDVQMQVGGVSEAVTVTSDAQVLKTESGSDVGTSVESAI